MKKHLFIEWEFIECNHPFILLCNRFVIGLSTSPSINYFFASISIFILPLLVLLLQFTHPLLQSQDFRVLHPRFGIIDISHLRPPFLYFLLI